MIEWTKEQKDTLVKLDRFIKDTSDSGYERPLVISGVAGTGKSFLISQYFKDKDLKYLVNTLSGKASNVLSRRGIPSETIHHCLYLPTDLNIWTKFMQKINYALEECNGVITENPNWEGNNPETQYILTYTGDRDIIYYVYKDRKGNEREEIVNSELDIPEGYECLKRHEIGVEQSIIGKLELFRHWNIEKISDVREFLQLEHIIGFEDLRDESEGGSWLFKLRAERLYKMDVLIIDEYGMVPPDMMQQLLDTCKELRVKLILSGDPQQLKPISEDKPIEFEADATLTQVMRQSADNPIYQFATLIRLYGVKKAIEQMSKNLEDGIIDPNKFIIVKEENVSDEFLQQYKRMNAQVICGTNRTRRWLNKRIKGNEKLEVGDKIIITDINDWDCNIDKSQCLTNGTQGVVKELYQPEYYFYPEYRPIFDDTGEIDYDNPIKVNSPTKYDQSHDYRLSNYICKVDFESTEGDHEYDNRKMKTIPLAICRSIDDSRFDDFQYLPKTNIYGYNSKGHPRKIKSADKLKYSYDHIVEHFEGSNKDENKVPKYMDSKETLPYAKCYTDYYSCPDYRKRKRVEHLDGGESRYIYNTNRTKPYYLNGHIADFGYAATCHKLQGSESDDVMIWAETFGGQTNSDIKHWLYTAVTRAKETLVLVITKSMEEYLGFKFE